MYKNSTVKAIAGLTYNFLSSIPNTREVLIRQSCKGLDLCGFGSFLGPGISDMINQ